MPLPTGGPAAAPGAGGRRGAGLRSPRDQDLAAGEDGARAEAAQQGAARWSDAITAAALFCIDPQGTGGVRLRTGAGAVRDAWFVRLGTFLGATPLRRIPAQVDEARLVGGIDLTATLRAGRPVAELGLLASSDGAVLVAPMAERMRPVTAALLSAVLDEGALRVERDGFSAVVPARIGVIACDEGIHADEQPPGSLIDRLAFWLDIDTLQWRDAAMGDALDELPTAAQVQAARTVLAEVQVPAAVCEALCGACAALGIHSLRIPLLALRVARAAAALAGCAAVGREHAALAARLVIAPRARQLPPPPADEEPQDDASDEAPGDPPDDAREDAPEQTPEPSEAQSEPRPPREEPPADDSPSRSDGELAEVVLDAARAVLPADLLAQISRGAARPAAGAAPGRTGMQVRSRLRGRPVGVRRGELRDGARLHVLETLRAAAPWQAMRSRVLPPQALGPGAAAPAAAPAPAPVARRRIQVRREDFRVVRFAQRTQTTVIFCVDASGSAAMTRLGEAKGAVELFLADCYVRRDQVALIAFRGRDAQLLLPPTRSLARARRSLAGVPGGGGTPVAAGLRMAASIADAVRRRGDVPLLVLLTDGKANVALDGAGGRERATQDALAMARLLRATAIRSLLVDFSQRAQAEALVLAQAIGARYLPLPRADAALVAGVVRAARLDVP